MLEIRLFGPGQACYFDQDLTGFPKQQAYLLLCYLLLNRKHPHAREQLVAIFWPEYSTDNSLTYLRNLVWRLRQALRSGGVPDEVYLLVDHETITFSTTSPYSLDIEIFETKVTHLRDIPGQALTSEQATQLEEAIGLYNGDLLEGIYEDWCLQERERLRLLYLNMLNKLMVYHQSNGSLERSLSYGQCILTRDPTSEKVHRRIMRLYWRLNARDKALAQYKRCVQLLREELGVTPMDETRRLYERMVHNNYDPSGQPLSFAETVFHKGQSDNGNEPLPDHTLQQLHRLQQSIEKTRVELRQMESLLATVLFHANYSQMYLERSAKLNGESKINKLYLNET